MATRPDPTEKTQTMSFSSHQLQVKGQKQLGIQGMSPQRPEEAKDIIQIQWPFVPVLQGNGTSPVLIFPNIIRNKM